MIEAIYCLSRPERQDRRDILMPALERAFAEGQLPRLPVTWWSEPLRQDVFVPGSFQYAPGYYAASLSHRLIMEDAWRKNYHEILVLEDDARFDEEFYRSFISFRAEIREAFPDWLALWLGWTLQHAPEVVGGNVMINRGCTQSHAYVINRHGIWRFLDHLFVRNTAVCDWAFCELMKNDACVYSPRTQQIGTIESISDNYHLIQRQT